MATAAEAWVDWTTEDLAMATGGEGATGAARGGGGGCVDDGGGVEAGASPVDPARAMLIRIAFIPHTSPLLALCSSFALPLLTFFLFIMARKSAASLTRRNALAKTRAGKSWLWWVCGRNPVV